MQITPEQDAFNKVWDHFVVKKSPKSINELGSCKYRKSSIASDPIKCAIGVLIPDDKYNPIFETPFCLQSILKQNEIELDLSFAVALQLAHDCPARTSDNFSEKIKCDLSYLAKDYKLTIPT